MSWIKALLPKNSRKAGLHLKGNQLSYCLLEPATPLPKLSDFSTHTFSDDALSENFQSLVNQLNLKGAQAYWLLNSEHYRIITIERPAVPDTELTDAIRWQIKEQIDFSIDEAAIEYFNYPEMLPGNNRLFVVVVHRSAIEQLVNLSKDAGLNLQAIDIPELAVGNLMLPSLQSGQNIALIAEGERGIRISCFAGNEFAFTRSLAGTFFPALKTSEDELTLDIDVGQSDAQDQMLLEVQRTLDYYESQIARQSITRLVVPDIGEQTSSLMSLLGDNLGMPVDSLAFDKLFQHDDSVSLSALAEQLGVCGCLFRDTEVVDATN